MSGGEAHVLTLVGHGGAGIGQGRLTDNLAQDIDLIDGAIHIPDAKTIRMIYHLLHEDGLYVGASTALNVVAAKELAEKLGKGSRVVTILCDAAYRSVHAHRWSTAGYGGRLLIPHPLTYPCCYHSSCATAGTRPGCSPGTFPGLSAPPAERRPTFSPPVPRQNVADPSR